MSRWCICAAPDGLARLRAHVLAADSEAEVLEVSDSWELRELLRGHARGASVVVGTGARGPSPVNVAAAIAADGSAGEVALVVADVSGSLRSRAKRAGVTRVMAESELAVRSPMTVQKEPRGLFGHDGGRAAEGGPCAGSGPARREGVPVVCLVSGRGGVGKTAVCAVAGHVAASWGLRVALLDLDLAFGNLYAACGAQAPADVTPAVRDGSLDVTAFGSCGAEVAERVGVWGPCALPEHAELVQPHAASLIASLTHEHDLVLVDTSSNWGDAVAAAAQQADRLLVVSDDRPGAVSSLARCGQLAARLGVARTRIVRVVNGCDPRGRDEGLVALSAQGLEGAREVRVLDGGEEAVELMASGHVAELALSDNPIATSVGEGLAQVLRELGRLPEGAGARKPGRGRRKARHLLRRKREVA